MGKFLKLNPNYDLAYDDYFIELGISTNHKREYAVKPDFHKIFFLNEIEDSTETIKYITVFKDDSLILWNGLFRSMFYFEPGHTYRNMDGTLTPVFLNGKTVEHLSLIYVIDCVKNGYNVYVSNSIGTELNKIFRHFDINNDNLIHSFTLLSIVLLESIFSNETRRNTEKPNKDEIDLYRAITKFTRNKTVREYPKTLEVIESIEEWTVIRNKVRDYVSQKRNHSPSSRGNNDWKNEFLQDDLKSIFKALVYVFHFRNRIELLKARKIGF